MKYLWYNSAPLYKTTPPVSTYNSLNKWERSSPSQSTYQGKGHFYYVPLDKFVSGVLLQQQHDIKNKQTYQI